MTAPVDHPPQVRPAGKRLLEAPSSLVHSLTGCPDSEQLFINSGKKILIEAKTRALTGKTPPGASAYFCAQRKQC